jgi:hypothetical protein
LAATYYFLQNPDEPSEVLRWFREQPEAPDEYPKGEATLLFFGQCGQMAFSSDGGVDVGRSPLVTVFKSQVRRQALWTVGEVHFLAARMRTAFPPLEILRQKFHDWLKSHEEVFDQRSPEDGLGYYLEGSARNVAERVFALPSGLTAIEAGRFFVKHTDNAALLDRICRSLRLRGVECA